MPKREKISNSHLCYVLRVFFFKTVIWSSTSVPRFFASIILLGREIIMSSLTSTSYDFQSSRICQKGKSASPLDSPPLPWPYFHLPCSEDGATKLSSLLSRPVQAMPWNCCLSSCQHNCPLTVGAVLWWGSAESLQQP